MRREQNIVALVLLLSLAAFAGDWPQYRGERRDGTTTEPIATTWPAGGSTAPAAGGSTQPARPRETWRAQVGRGHAAVSVAAGRVVTLGYTGTPPAAGEALGDTVWCLDAVTGKELWRFDYPAVARLKGEPGGGAYDGPHAAPAIHDGRVYTLSRDGKIHCLDLANGKAIWKRDLPADQKAKLPECGFAGSPLILDGMVIVSVGAYGTALDAATGETKWQSPPEIAGYGAPVLSADAQGVKRLLFFAYKDLTAVNPADGKVLWSVPWPTKWGANAADPVAVGDAVFISSAYERGCALVGLATGEVRWQNRALSSQCSPLVLRAGNLYGFDGYINYDPKNQSLVCLDPLTGTVRWRQAGLAGQMILAGDKLVLLLITGDLVVAKAAPAAYEELARARIQPAEDCPIPPTLVNGRLYCRTGKGALVCLDVKP